MDARQLRAFLKIVEHGSITRAADALVMSLPAIREEIQSGRLSAARLENGSLRRTLCLVRNSSVVVTRASVRVEDLTIKIMQRLMIKGCWHIEPEPGLT